MCQDEVAIGSAVLLEVNCGLRLQFERVEGGLRHFHSAAPPARDINCWQQRSIGRGTNKEKRIFTVLAWQAFDSPDGFKGGRLEDKGMWWQCAVAATRVARLIATVVLMYLNKWSKEWQVENGETATAPITSQILRTRCRHRCVYRGFHQTVWGWAAIFRADGQHRAGVNGGRRQPMRGEHMRRHMPAITRAMLYLGPFVAQGLM